MNHSLTVRTHQGRRIAIRMLGTLLLLLACSAVARAQVEVTTTEDNVYVGSVVQDERDTLRFLTSDGIQMAIPRGHIRSIEYGGDMVDRRKSSSYWTFGAAVGTPAGLNLVFGRIFNDNLGLRLSGMYFGTAVEGFQLDLVKVFRTSKGFAHQPFVGLGATHTDASEYYDAGDWTYLMAGYGMNFWGVHANVGLSIGIGSFTNPQLQFQIGYVHEFR